MARDKVFSGINIVGLAVGIAALACSPGGALLVMAAVSKLALTSTAAKISFFGASTVFAGAAIAMNVKQRHDQNKCQPMEPKKLVINGADSDLIDREFQL